ncbi:hypothetical protein ACFLU5_09320, partial [Bacteroidota bacterium]
MDKKASLAVLISILTITAWFVGCQECNDCGVLYEEPTVKVKFYNIDSLLKVDSALLVIEDSLGIINEEIENGDTVLIELKEELERIKSGLEKTQQDINNGKLRIEEVNGIGALEPFYFRDSTTNDSLTSFQFPLSMNNNVSTFIIEIEDRIDTLMLGYLLMEDVGGSKIYIRAYDLELG